LFFIELFGVGGSIPFLPGHVGRMRASVDVTMPLVFEPDVFV
jgi:hypothetical protein